MELLLFLAWMIVGNWVYSHYIAKETNHVFKKNTMIGCVIEFFLVVFFWPLFVRKSF